MGTWGPLAFDNDTANDWAYDLEKTTDLSLIESALHALEPPSPVDASLAEIALAACEVLARLRGHFGYENAYTKEVDAWVRAHPQTVPASLSKRARDAIARVLAEDSELRELWDDDPEWRDAVEDLRGRLGG